MLSVGMWRDGVKRQKESSHLVLAEEVDGTRQQSDLATYYGHVNNRYVKRWLQFHSATATNCAHADSNTKVIVIDS